MAWNPLPQSWIPSLTDNGTVLSANISDFPELTAAEIDSVTGDIRKFLFAFCEKMWSVWSSLLTADKSLKMTLAKTVSVNPITGVITNTYTFVFLTAVSSQEVVSET
jgi:hypothetical protein